MAKYNHVLIVGDFNVHVCCPEKNMAKDFLNATDFILCSLFLVPHKSMGIH